LWLKHQQLGQVKQKQAKKGRAHGLLRKIITFVKQKAVQFFLSPTWQAAGLARESKRATFSKNAKVFY